MDIEVWWGVYIEDTIGAGVEYAIGVVEAAGIGRVSGASNEIFGDNF